MKREGTLSVRGKRVLVFGLGVQQGGVGVAAWCARHGARVTVTDLKPRTQLAASVAALRRYRTIQYVLGRHRMKDVDAADMIIQNPGVPNTSPYMQRARARHIPIYNEASLFLHSTITPVIGITGTKGKSTTTTFLGTLVGGTMQRTAVVGNIRKSFFSVVDRLGARDLIIAEFSSWHLEGTAREKQSPHIAIITNVYEDHLNRYASFAAYQKAKEGIVRFQQSDDIAIVNRDNAVTRRIGKTVPGRRYWFSVKPFSEENGAMYTTRGLVIRENGTEHLIVAASRIPFTAADTRANLLAAVLGAWCAGRSAAAIRSRIPLLRLPAGRREVIRHYKNRVFINDTTATAPAATIEALRALPRPLILIVGGVNKKLHYRELAREIRAHADTCILLPGTATDALRKALKRVGYTKSIPAATMEDAVHIAWAHSVPGSRILLSPAAASFNLFQNEFARGDAFVDAVRRIR